MISLEATSPEPGQTCGLCKRRVPHPKKETTPTTKPVSYRVPLDELDAHHDVLTETAKHLGTAERPYWQFWTYTYALARALQDEEMRGVAQRSDVA